MNVLKLKLMILRKLIDKKGNKIDNRTMTWQDWKDKVLEESGELCEALSSGNKLDIMEEVLDVIQVGIGILAKLFRENFDIVQGFHRHNKKLVDRGCEACAEVNFNVSRK
ncbi:MazG-like family protein [Clostridium kluyveri]|uniref:MazG-like family protein n=1 Tax=Clostridium kluyveri TaxID=1534 RepID=UPI002248644F|nr:MazG-like family protein [Clostridium kluyveri]UZQ49834.1 MazG-like family protein [Clostridium kluyveri]